MNRYLIVIEESETGYSAFSPDLEGCVATGATKEEVEKRMREAVEFHLDGLKAEGIPIPLSHSFSAYFEVPA